VSFQGRHQLWPYPADILYIRALVAAQVSACACDATAMAMPGRAQWTGWCVLVDGTSSLVGLPRTSQLQLSKPLHRRLPLCNQVLAMAAVFGVQGFAIYLAVTNKALGDTEAKCSDCYNRQVHWLRSTVFWQLGACTRYGASGCSRWRHDLCARASICQSARPKRCFEKGVRHARGWLPAISFRQARCQG
jgi:hypothetical protein